MANFPINVIIDPAKAKAGSTKVQRELGRIENKADNTGRAIKRALGFISFGLLTRGLVGLTDQFTDIQNRLKLVTRGEEDLIKVTRELNKVANATRVSFESTAQLYSRTALAVKELGIEQTEVLKFTERLNKAVILSGASAEEARAGIIQLSQGLASGTLRGDELRSVLEQLPFVADIISKSLGVTRGELRELGTQGKINAEVILKAFREAGDEIDTAFAGTVGTIGQAFVVLRNNLSLFVGEFDKSRGISASFAKGIVALSNNIETLARSIIAVSTALLVNYARTALPAAIRATKSFTAALLRNPFGLIAVGIATAVGALVGFGDQLKVSEDSVVTWADRVNATIEVLGKRFQKLFLSVALIFANLVDAAADFARALLPDALLGAFEKGMERVNESFKVLGQSLSKGLGLDDLLADIKKVEERLAKARREGDGSIGLTAPQPAPEKRRIVVGEEIFQALRRENALLLEGDEIKRRVLEAEFKLADKGKELVGDRRVQLENLIASNEQFKIRRELLDELTIDTDALAKRESVLVDLRIADLITQKQFIREQRKIKILLLENSTSLADGIERGLLQVQQNLTDFASFAEDSITRAFQGGEDAIVEFAKTGEFAFNNFIESVLTDLLRLIVRLQITIPLAKSLSAALSGGGGGITSELGSLFGSFFGGASPTGAQVTAASNINSSTSSFFGPGFATGGSFMVGGSGGTDSQNVRFRASPNEEVTIRTPSQQRAGGGPRTIVNVINQSSKSETKQSQSTGPNGDLQIEVMIVDIVANDINEGGKIANNIGEFFGSSAQPLSRG